MDLGSLVRRTVTTIGAAFIVTALEQVNGAEQMPTSGLQRIANDKLERSGF